MSLTPDLEANYDRLSSWNAAQNKDRLQDWRFAVPRLKEAFRLFTADDPIDELHMRKPNGSGGTTSLAAWVLACCQKRASLDGVPVPQWKGRVEAAQLVLDYKQQILSVQPAYMRLLEGWTFKARYVGEALSALRIKPVNGSDNEAEWSVVHFLSQENKRSGLGVRADVIAFDEPPVIEILRELRKAAHANRRMVMVIAATPTIRRQWAPIREDYGDTPRRSIRRVDQERAEVRWSLDEVADWVLPAHTKAKMLRKYSTDPLAEAREHGDYTNTEGKCPFDVPTLLEMLGGCADPVIEQWRVSRETEEGTNTVVKVPYQVWKEPQADKLYYVDVDPASGVDDNAHNPAGLHVSEVGSGDLVARWNGYLAPYSVGVLAAGLARQYKNASIDVETNDHWGINVVRGIQACRYGNIAYEQRELKPGEWSKEVGFHNNEKARAIIIGSIQEWLSAWKAGVKYAACPSRAVLECLLDSELDDRGKIVAGPGIAHGEDMILWGQKLRRVVSRSNREIPDIQTAPKTADDALIAMIQGKAQPRNGSVLPRPRRRPSV